MLDSAIIVLLVLAALAVSLVIGTYRRFAAQRMRLLAYLPSAAPELSVTGLTDVGFTAQVLGAHVEVDLASLARRRPRGMDERAWFDRVIDGLRAKSPIAPVPPLALVRDRLLPQLKPTAYVDVFERYPPPLHLVWQPLAPGIAITYIVSGLHTWTAVTAVTLETWRLSVTGLHALALANLRAQTEHLLTELGGPQERYEHIDGLDAARILILDLIAPPAIRDPVVAIPEETVLLIAPRSGAAELAEESARRHAASPRPLSPRIFEPAADGSVRLVEPAGP